MSDADDIRFLEEVIRIAVENVETHAGGPFGAIVVRGGEIIARGMNRVVAADDPTAHAEVVAIREACRMLGSFQLTGCTVYSSTEPCPMCLGAIYWARPDRLLFASSKRDAAAVGFDDQLIYDELARPLEERLLPTVQVRVEGALEPFRRWAAHPGRVDY